MTHGHIVEIPCIFNARFYHEVYKIVTCNIFNVFACVAHRNTEQTAVLFEKLHRFHRIFVCAFAASEVVALLRALNAQRKRKITHASDLLAEIVIDKRAVGVRHERTIGKFLAELDNVCFSYEGFTAREHVKMRSELPALRNDRFHFVVREILTVAVFRRPAALAFEVACACRIKQNDPRNVTVIFFAVRSYGFRSEISGIYAERQKHML